MKVKGKIKIDSGAIAALNIGKSLLSAGVIEVFGTFSRGDPIEIIDENHNSFAKGLVNYDNSETTSTSKSALETEKVSEVGSAPKETKKPKIAKKSSSSEPKKS